MAHTAHGTCLHNAIPLTLCFAGTNPHQLPRLNILERMMSEGLMERTPRPPTLIRLNSSALAHIALRLLCLLRQFYRFC